MLGIVAGAVYDKSKQSEPDPSLSSNSVTPQDPDLPSVTTSSDPYYHNVIYEIGGTARSVSISYDTPLGSNDESHLMPPGAIFPKRRPLGYRFDPDQYVSISVLNEGLYGSVSCRIIVDNRVVSRSSSDQSFVNCDARTPLPPF